MSYSVKILSSEEFNRLPYARVETSLGLADPATNTAYVRHSSIPELNKYLIDHEFEHLIEEIATDEVDGIRYKDLGGIFNGIGGGIKSGIGALGSGFGNVASGIGSTLGSFGQGFGSTVNQPANPVGSMAQSAGNGIMSAFTPKNILGAGLIGAGLLKGMPKVPPLPDSVNQLKGQVQAGGSPLGQLAQSKLTDQLNQTYNPLTQPEIDAALRQLELDQSKATDQVKDLYRNLRPGTDPSSDSAYQRDLAQVNDQYSRAKADTLATRTRDTQAIFNQQQAQAIQQSLGASNEQMNQLSQLAQLDINQIMTKLQMDYQQALLFKQTFIGLGSSLLSPPSVLDQLFAGRTA